MACAVLLPKYPFETKAQRKLIYVLKFIKC